MTFQQRADGVVRYAGMIAGALIAVMFAAIVLGVFMRYVLESPLAWTDELAVCLLLWATFLGGAFAVRTDEHVSFDVIYAALPPGGRRGMRIVGSLAFGLLFLAAVPAVVDYTRFLWRERTTVMQIRLDWLYSVFAVFLIAIALDLLWQGSRLFGRRWREYVDRDVPTAGERQ